MPIKRIMDSYSLTIESSKSISNLCLMIQIGNKGQSNVHFAKNYIFVMQVLLNEFNRSLEPCLLGSSLPAVGRRFHDVSMRNDCEAKS
jgi:hypothetical protein